MTYSDYSSNLFLTLNSTPNKGQANLSIRTNFVVRVLRSLPAKIRERPGMRKI
jgi:hypothetical protein